MIGSGLPFDPVSLPHAGSAELAALGMARWREAVERTEDAALASFARDLGADRVGARLLEALFGNSPFLTFAIERDPGFFRDLLEQGPDAVVERVMAELTGEDIRAQDEAGLARALRVAKRRVALAVAVADIGGLWSLEQVTGALSRLAEVALSRASAHLLKAFARRGVFTLRHEDDPERDSGLIILGMGKLGARELNYSSDIDIIVLFDAERVRTSQPTTLQTQFVRLTRGLMRLMDERTADGYVFRTDLRLRPDPGSTPIAISVLAAEHYYESLGQNWERAAMIKVRPVAGDLEAGARFVDGLRPYVWRKNLDFAAIQDVHSIKRQINAHRGGEAIAVGGHNVKLGRGGIREIEFFAQTQQLIWGGKEPRLRTNGTVPALRALVEVERVTPEAMEELVAAYRFLRRLEHRLQMIDDKQTHVVPEDEEELRRVAVFMGHADREAFARDLLFHLRRVERHYAALFEDEPDLSLGSVEGGNLVFTGGEPDPDTLRTLERLGFKSPQAVDGAVRGWHHGRYRATRSTRARELLTEMMPRLLQSLGATAAPDVAFARFDAFLERLPSGVQLFAMIHANPHLLELMAEIMGGAPRLADHLAHHPQVLESVLSGDFFEEPPAPEDLDLELDRLLTQARSFEEVLDITRRWAADRRFQVGVQCLQDHLATGRAGLALGNIADTALGRLLPRVEDEFATRHGRLPGMGMVIVAMGKLGGREMTPTSDLDLIFVYDTPDLGARSDGERPLPATQYFARFSQRMINAVTARTAEGGLYEVDMRLRPSGKAGPIASTLEAFTRYHHEQAWTWEHMALTRARVVAGPGELRRKVEAVIRDTLTRPRDSDRLLCDVASMRSRMEQEHGTDVIWEIKHLRGGLVDVEFIAQYLSLRHAHDHPEILSTNTRQTLENLKKTSLLPREDADRLLSALNLWHSLQGMLRLTVDGRFHEEREDDVSGGLRSALTRRCGARDFAALKDEVRETAAAVQEIFDALITSPARALAGEPCGGEGDREPALGEPVS